MMTNGASFPVELTPAQVAFYRSDFLARQEDARIEARGYQQSALEFANRVHAITVDELTLGKDAPAKTEQK